MGRVLSESVTDELLGETVEAGTQVLAGTPTARLQPLAQLDGAELGLWEMTAGRVTDVEADEVFVVIAGRGTLTLGDGTSVALRPGVVVRLDEGERTTWTVTETLRKVYLTAADG